MPDEFITRSEYEARNEVNQQNMIRLEAKIDQINTKLDTAKDDKLKFIMNMFITLFAGGGIVAYLELLVKH
jgi:hypothetical protein